MTERALRAWAAASRVVGAVVGGLAIALGGAVCVAASLPGASGLGLPLAMALTIPAWMAATCRLLLVPSARRVWAASIVLSATLVAATAALRLVHRG